MLTHIVCAKIAAMMNVTPALAEQAQAHPQDTFHVILRVQGDMDARQEQLQEMGFAISRRLRLIRGFGATATGECLTNARNHDWIVSIEPDGEMHTLNK